MMLPRLPEYERLVYTLPDQFPTILQSTLVVIRHGPTLAELSGVIEFEGTFPHHKHVHPNIKRHRVPAPGISFEHPNLFTLIEEIERDLFSP